MSEEEEEPRKLEARSELEIWPWRSWIAWWMPFEEASGGDLVGEREEDVGEDDQR